MFISKKIAEYFKENKDKPKTEIIKGLIEMGYKESTAKAYYANRNVVKYEPSNGTSQREIAFNFFEITPEALIPHANDKIYAKELDIQKSTYSAYKYMYMAIKDGNKGTLRNRLDRDEGRKEGSKPLYGEKYYKGRLRQKFKIDDSSL